MTLLVTGGAGFIGSNFILYTLERRPEYRVVCLDKLTYAGRRDTLAAVMERPGFRFVQADICDRGAVNRLFEEERPDAVVNFAAESHVDRSIDAPEVFLQTNVLGTAVLMDACRTHGLARFHQVSTDEVYGDLPLDRPDLLFTEASPLRASSPYSASKASGDLLALAYCRTYGLPVTISRCSNNYGPYQFAEKLIPLMISRALEDRPLPVGVYNVGGRCEMRNIDIVKLICRELGKPDSLIAYVEDRKGHDLRYAIDPSRIQNELGWTPETGFQDGIRRTIRWYAERRDWREGDFPWEK